MVFPTIILSLLPPLMMMLIGLHGFVAMRTKRFGAGTIQLQRSDARLMVGAAILLLLSILTTTLVGQTYLR